MTDYWLTHSHNLGVSYLSDDKLPLMLRWEEGYVPVPYSDTVNIATIGMG